jgi:hypothetical protein
MLDSSQELTITPGICPDGIGAKASSGMARLSESPGWPRAVNTAGLSLTDWEERIWTKRMVVRVLRRSCSFKEGTSGARPQKYRVEKEETKERRTALDSWQPDA